MTSAVEQYSLTPKLLETVEGLRSPPDDKMRYKQLLYMATQCADLDAVHKVPVRLGRWLPLQKGRLSPPVRGPPLLAPRRPARTRYRAA